MTVNAVLLSVKFLTSHTARHSGFIFLRLKTTVDVYKAHYCLPGIRKAKASKMASEIDNFIVFW